MKKLRPRLYEGMYILNATLSEESRQKALDKILDGITEKGGEIHKVHSQGRKRLAFEIDGKREGYYFIIYFTVSSNMIKDLWRDYNLHEDLIRFMTRQTSEVKEEMEFIPLKQQ